MAGFFFVWPISHAQGNNPKQQFLYLDETQFSNLILPTFLSLSEQSYEDH